MNSKAGFLRALQALREPSEHALIHHLMNPEARVVSQDHYPARLIRGGHPSGQFLTFLRDSRRRRFSRVLPGGGGSSQSRGHGHDPGPRTGAAVAQRSLAGLPHAQRHCSRERRRGICDFEVSRSLRWGLAGPSEDHLDH